MACSVLPIEGNRLMKLPTRARNLIIKRGYVNRHTLLLFFMYKEGEFGFFRTQNG